MTNSRSLSWIDRGRWAGLLARVTDEPVERTLPWTRRAPPPGPRRTSPMRAVGSVPPIPMPSAALPRRRSSTAPGAPVATQRPPLPSVPPPPTAAAAASLAEGAPAQVVAPPAAARPVEYPPFAAAAPQLEERLQALVAWIERCVPCRAAFIADDNGLPVVEHLATEPGYVAAASSILMMLASVRTLLRDSGGWLSLKLGTQVLNVVEVGTRWGRFGIGVVTEDALPREFLMALSTAVERAFHGDPSQGD